MSELGPVGIWVTERPDAILNVGEAMSFAREIDRVLAERQAEIVRLREQTLLKAKQWAKGTRRREDALRQIMLAAETASDESADLASQNDFERIRQMAEAAFESKDDEQRRGSEAVDG